MTTAYILRTAVQNVGAIILGIAKCGVMGIVFSHTIGSLCGIKRQGKKLIEKKDIICFQKTRRLIIEAKKIINNHFFYTSYFCKQIFIFIHFIVHWETL